MNLLFLEYPQEILQKSNYNFKSLDVSNIKSFRLGFLRISFFRKLLEKLLLIKEYTTNQKLIHINEAFFPQTLDLFISISCQKNLWRIK